MDLTTVYQKLLHTVRTKRAGYLVLLDPDKMPLQTIPSFIAQAEKSGVDGLLIGGSLILSSDFQKFVEEIKKYSNDIPIILFPGSVHQITPEADALLFLSLISGREAQHIIGSQVLAAPLIYRIGIETISTAYMLVDSGRLTSAQFMSGTLPLPRNKPDIVVAHALAAQYLGFKLIYLEGGSGAEQSVPVEVISAVTKVIDTPLIVGGGICTPDDAAAKVKAGASFIVTGNVLESSSDPDLMFKLAQGVHQAI
jgi:putative glycerol-1-phosphate prenyltransferase